MTHRSDPRLLVLHGLRLKGFAQPEAVAPAIGLDPGEVAGHLDALLAEELVLKREGRLSGWSLTPSGRKEHERLLHDELHTAGCRDTVDAAYRRFLAVNAEMLGVCTAWQMRDEHTPNDHSDPAYDREVIVRLEAIHGEVTPVVDDLVGVLGRYEPYPARFGTALQRVRGGEREWFTRPIIDSYHTVWFELHEDLLATLGIERAKEGQA